MRIKAVSRHLCLMPIRTCHLCRRRSKCLYFGSILFVMFVVLSSLHLSRKRTDDDVIYAAYSDVILSDSVMDRHDALPSLNQYEYSSDFLHSKVQSVNCSMLYQGDETALLEAKTVQENITRDADLALRQLQQSLQDCSLFRRQFVTRPLQREIDEEFPLAFSILFYKDVDQVVRLLRAIYRPQNYYCLHLDKKAPAKLHQTTQRLTQCFDNVFVATEAINVHWGWYSVVQPDVRCLKDLWKYSSWKYFINLTGQEFPLRTNLELIQILKSYNGGNAINGQKWDSLHDKESKMRLKYSVRVRSKRRVRYKKPSFEYNVTWAKGAVHVALSRPFVDYLLHNKVGRALRQYIYDTAHASEHLFNPLQFSPQLGVPGSYTGNKTQLFTDVRFKLWDTNHLGCAGKYSRDICIIGTGDLWKLHNSTAMFINKLHADFEPLAYSCLEERIYRHIREDAGDEATQRIDLRYYAASDIATNNLNSLKRVTSASAG